MSPGYILRPARRKDRQISCSAYSYAIRSRNKTAVAPEIREAGAPQRTWVPHNQGLVLAKVPESVGRGDPPGINSSGYGGKDSPGSRPGLGFCVS